MDRLLLPTHGSGLRKLLLAHAMGVGGGVEKTVTGSLVTVTDALAKPAKSLIVNFAPVQSGSGDPSPSNVRPITGWTGVTAYVGPTSQQADATTYPVDWTDDAGTVYGGYVDLVSGVLVATHGFKDLSNLNWSYDTSGAYPYFYANLMDAYRSIGVITTFCSAYESIADAKYVDFRAGNYNLKICMSTQSANPQVMVQDSSYSAANDFKNALSGVQFVYTLKNPVTYQLTRQAVAMLKGTNNVWSNADGDVSLTYLAKK